MLRNWDRIKEGEEGRERGIFAEVPENLPALLHARKVQRRVVSTGFEPAEPLAAVAAELEELSAAPEDRERAFREVGDVLFTTVDVACRLRVDPELSLRAASERFRDRVQRAEALAARAGRAWQDLAAEQQLGFYAQVRTEESASRP